MRPLQFPKSGHLPGSAHRRSPVFRRWIASPHPPPRRRKPHPEAFPPRHRRHRTHLARLMHRLFLALFATAAFCQTPLHYTCHRAQSPIHVDGILDDAAWQDAAWTNDFVDIQGADHAAPRFRTRVKMMWDDQYFYVAAELKSRTYGPPSPSTTRSYFATTISRSSSIPPAIPSTISNSR